MLVSSLKENRMLIIEGLNLKTSEKSNSLSKNNFKTALFSQKLFGRQNKNSQYYTDASKYTFSYFGILSYFSYFGIFGYFSYFGIFSFLLFAKSFNCSFRKLCL
jgi:hypothetical protein